MREAGSRARGLPWGLSWSLQTSASACPCTQARLGALPSAGSAVARLPAVGAFLKQVM